MAVLIKNPSVEVCALPFPLKGLLKGGQDVIINCTYAALIAACPSITNLHVENLGDSYASGTSDTSARTTWAKDTYVFAAGDVIDVRIRAGSGWTATAADLGVALEVEC